jgi:hypothetical protein
MENCGIVVASALWDCERDGHTFLDWARQTVYSIYHGNEGASMSWCQNPKHQSWALNYFIYFPRSKRISLMMQQTDEISKIAQFRVTMATNYRSLISYVGVSYVISHERETILLFQCTCIVSIPWMLMKLRCEYAKRSILHTGDSFKIDYLCMLLVRQH